MLNFLLLARLMHPCPLQPAAGFIALQFRAKTNLDCFELPQEMALLARLLQQQHLLHCPAPSTHCKVMGGGEMRNSPP